MKHMLLKSMTILTLLMVSLCGVTGEQTEARTTDDQDLIIVNKYYNKIAYFRNGYLEMLEPVATGMSWDKTPVGFFKIVNKIKNRPYYTGNISGGDSRNPLGKRWLGINANGTSGDTYAIHGNNNPNSIGKYVSQGCIRMDNTAIEKLFDQVQVGTPVAITYSYKSFVELTDLYGYDIRS